MVELLHPLHPAAKIHMLKTYPLVHLSKTLLEDGIFNFFFLALARGMWNLVP